jgi:hypothetical protein
VSFWSLWTYLWYVEIMVKYSLKFFKLSMKLTKYITFISILKCCDAVFSPGQTIDVLCFLLHDRPLCHCVLRQCWLQLKAYSACAWIVNWNLCACMFKNAVYVDESLQGIPLLYFSSHKRYYVSNLGPQLSITLQFIYLLTFKYRASYI